MSTKGCPVGCIKILRCTGLLMVFLAIIAGPAVVRAQDAHYWDNQYGTKAELLGGLVVGSSTDLSSTFYNPGWIALQKGGSVLLTTKAAEIYTVTMKDDLGRGTEPSSTVVAPSPGYLAGRFSLGNDYGWQWAYTYLQKVKFEFDSSGLRIDQNPAPPPAGNFWFSGEAFRIARVDESWYGVSMSRKLSDNVAVGFSPYVAQRNQRSRTQIAAQLLDANTIYSDTYLVEEYKYWHIRMLLKAGVAAEWDKWSAGLAITTPSVGLLGDGSVYQNVALSGDYDPDNPGVDPPYLQANTQEGLKPVWKSPLSIAAGGAVNLGATRIHITTEWFNNIVRYRVLDPVTYEIQSQPGTYDRFDIEYAAKNVFNYGVGVNHDFTPRFSLFTSYRADYSTTPPDIDATLSISVWDLNHLTGGASFQFLSLEFTAGLQYSWGSGFSNRHLSFNENEDGSVVGDFEDREITYKRLKALLGFNLPFAVPGDPN